jgi:hypothetical protein
MEGPSGNSIDVEVGPDKIVQSWRFLRQMDKNIQTISRPLVREYS